MQHKILLFILLLIAIASCEKTSETRAVITVKDINGSPIEGVTVWLSQNGQISPQGAVSNISDQQITDSRGQTIHVFELEKVLNIDAQKTLGNNYLSGTGVVKLVRDETVFKTVLVN